MGTKNEENESSHGESQRHDYPFGLSSNQFAVLVILIGLIGPGLLVYSLEQANLSTAADLVWIVGYGTTIFVGWFVWLRPLDLVGSTGQDIPTPEKPERSDTEPEKEDTKSNISDSTELPAKDSPVSTEDES